MAGHQQRRERSCPRPPACGLRVGSGPGMVPAMSFTDSPSRRFVVVVAVVLAAVQMAVSVCCLLVVCWSLVAADQADERRDRIIGCLVLKPDSGVCSQ